MGVIPLPPSACSLSPRTDEFYELARAALPVTKLAARTSSSCEGNLPKPAKPSLPHSMCDHRTMPSRSMRNWPFNCVNVVSYSRRSVGVVLVTVQRGESVCGGWHR